MRKQILTTVIVMCLLLPLLAPAQGTLYVSNLGQTSTGGAAIGSDSWIAQGFYTGTNSGGYILNSVQLLLNAASGTPSNFMISVYAGPRGPETFLTSLNGSIDPTAAGIYDYTSTSGISLSPMAEYFIVVTAETTMVNGAYELSQCAASFNSSDGWFVPNGSWFSINGMSWNTGSGSVDSQFAIYATAAPEPSILALAGLGLAAFSFWRRKS